ncbi:hypothetical protein AAFF_G00153710 [Aldrovandia affinis]|uniref:Reticulon-1 n=1 Tax=Aldrovandia affinis TaxID=143900 RepID=A0AAD7WWN4_9TELE|nr:hypothetical protein AAFF_G00153710 [Aldrovandia affinis]
MSVKPSEEQGSEGRWFGEDFEKIDCFGSTVPRFDERGDELQPQNWEDETTEQKQQCLYDPESNRQRPPVAMETASTGGNASLFDSLTSKGDSDLDLLRTSSDNDGDLYTSLLSSQSYSFQRDASYFTGDLKGDEQKHTAAPLRDRIPSLESHGMFSSDSGIEMTPGESIDVAKNLLESERMEAYNYMDISRGDDARPQPGSWEETASAGPDSLGNLGRYLEKGPSGAVESLGPALDSHSFPYVEDPSDEELSESYQSYRALGTPQTASPVRITLTETPAVPAPLPRPQVAVSERESILSLGLEGVPTVTLSEPEDDSPGSTPPLIEEDSPSDPLFQAQEVKRVSSAPRQGFTAAPPPSSSLPQPGPAGKGRKTGSSKSPASASRDQEASSAESGDSEIELVSEEPPPPPSRPLPPGVGYMSFGQMGGPAPAPHHAASIQYSILREEREAELDSELIIESCDASSASEESPKRGQDSPPATKGRPPASAAKEKPAGDKTKSSIGADDEPEPEPEPHPSPARAPMEQPPPPEEEKKGWKMRRASGGRRASEGGAVAPAVLQGFSRQKGEFARSRPLELQKHADGLSSFMVACAW